MMRRAAAFGRLPSLLSLTLMLGMLGMLEPSALMAAGAGDNPGGGGSAGSTPGGGAAGKTPGGQAPAAGQAQGQTPAAPPSQPKIMSPSTPAPREETIPSVPARPPTERPFRTTFMALNPGLDQQKPLAAMDPAGFIVNSGLLIGQIEDGWVGGFSLATKTYQWWYDGKVTMTSPPGAFGASVVVGFRDGKLVRLDAETGRKIWTANIDSFTERPMLLNDKTLYVVSAAQVLYAIDYQSGKTLWLFDGGFPEGLTIRGGARPVIHENKVIFGVASGEIIGVSLEGKLVWRYNPAYNDARFHDTVGEMIVRNNRLLITRYDGLVAAIDLGSSVRSVAWSERLPGLTTSTFRGDRYYVGGLNGDVYALDPDNGFRRIWRAVTGIPVTTITAGETSLYVAGSGGRVTVLDATTGTLQWYDRLGSSLASPPVLFEDAILFTTGMKTVYGYKIR
jgi:outer membrane protein assembly factor BamB